jgi:hypothetical protein
LPELSVPALNSRMTLEILASALVFFICHDLISSSYWWQYGYHEQA